MDVGTLASMPIFTASLAFCGLVGAYACTVLLRWLLTKASIIASSAAASPEELKTIEFTERFYRQFNTYMRHINDLEFLSKDFPKTLNDQTWRQLLQLKSQLEIANEQLGDFLENEDVDRALPLSRFLCGEQVRPAPIKGLSDELVLESLISWQYNSLKLIQRMAAKFEDAASQHNASATSPLPEDFSATLKSLRKRIVQDEKRYREPK
jgi:hypothetical protein